ncbi:MAG: PfkB family carbohydrate kinase [Planctomycetales bacterium]|nr:PfkB family carbohydrate kinase [Planctomycetales bacterium]
MTPPPRSRLLALVEKFPSARVAVVGDLIADVYLYGRPYRLSREAPVPVVQYEGEQVIPGGAANTVANVAALGARCSALGILGADPPGEGVRRRLREMGADLSGIVEAAGGASIVKTRILAGLQNTRKQQIARIDRDPPRSRGEAAAATLASSVRALGGKSQGLVVSDYGYDALGEPVVAAVRELAESVPVLVDSHRRMREFGGAAIATPNEEELENATGIRCEDDDSVLGAGEHLRREVGLRALLVTRGNRGMALLEEGRPPALIPIVGSGEVADVTGAGDTVAAVLILGLASGGTFLEAAHLANAAASLVVMKMGAATLTREELSAAVTRATKG